MQSSIIGKIEKAKRYAQEPERVTFIDFSVNFRGSNDTHTTGYRDNKWFCSCDFFAGWGLCCHSMALEQMLGKMLPKEAQTNFEAAARA